MKKLALTLLCASIAAPALAAGSSYVTGNVQLHDRTDFNGSDVTSTLEAGHTFTTGTTLLVEFDGIQLGETSNAAAGQWAGPAFTTLGIEQSFNVNDKLWVAAGYHQVMYDGDVWQYRPLVKIGYNFDNGVSISNRTRLQIDGEAGKDQTRFDNNIAYQFKNMPVNVKYNNVFYINDNDDNTLDNSMEHEIRATWTRAGVQPYVEYRNQEDASKTGGHNNNVFVVGASYGF